MHSERPKLHRVLAVLSAIGLKSISDKEKEMRNYHQVFLLSPALSTENPIVSPKVVGLIKRAKTKTLYFIFKCTVFNINDITRFHANTVMKLKEAGNVM